MALAEQDPNYQDASVMRHMVDGLVWAAEFARHPIRETSQVLGSLATANGREIVLPAGVRTSAQLELEEAQQDYERVQEARDDKYAMFKYVSEARPQASGYVGKFATRCLMNWHERGLARRDRELELAAEALEARQRAAS